MRYERKGVLRHSAYRGNACRNFWMECLNQLWVAWVLILFLTLFKKYILDLIAGNPKRDLYQPERLQTRPKCGIYTLSATSIPLRAFIWEFLTFHILMNYPEFSFTTGTYKRYLRIIPLRSRRNNWKITLSHAGRIGLRKYNCWPLLLRM